MFASCNSPTLVMTLIFHSKCKMSSRYVKLVYKVSLYIVKLVCLMQGSLGQSVSSLIAMYLDMALYSAQNNDLVSIQVVVLM